MQMQTRIDAAVLLGMLRGDLISCNIGIALWNEPVSVLHNELTLDEPEAVVIANTIRAIGNIPIEEFPAQSSLAIIMAGINRLERVLGVSPCDRNRGLSERDDLSRSRFEQIFDRAEAEFANESGRAA